jgi:branched-chain amino acid transport system ATP-binding protein
MEALDFVGLAPVAHERVRSLRAKERRFIEVARAVVGSPKVVMLDEPAAGLPDEETAELQGIIRAIPDRTGATVILVDHDMELVQACCAFTAVLDFGSLLASGPTAEVLRNERVMQAYLGVDE